VRTGRASPRAVSTLLVAAPLAAARVRPPRPARARRRRSAARALHTGFPIRWPGPTLRWADLTGPSQVLVQSLDATDTELGTAMVSFTPGRLPDARERLGRAATQLPFNKGVGTSRGESDRRWTRVGLGTDALRPRDRRPAFLAAPASTGASPCKGIAFGRRGTRRPSRLLGETFVAVARRKGAPPMPR